MLCNVFLNHKGHSHKKRPQKGGGGVLSIADKRFLHTNANTYLIFLLQKNIRYFEKITL